MENMQNNNVMIRFIGAKLHIKVEILFLATPKSYIFYKFNLLPSLCGK